MIFFCIFQFHVFAYTVYPTVNNTFIYPLSDLGLDNAYNCSTNGWQIIESIQKSNTIIQEEIISITLGYLDNGYNQSYYAGVLTNSTINLYQMVENGTFESFQSVNYNRSIYNCSNLIFQNNSLNLVIMCTQQQQISILFYQNQQLNSLNISSIQIDVGDLQQTNITQIKSQIALSYIFTNYSTVYQLIQNNGVVTSIKQYANYTGQFIQLFVAYNGVVFGMTQSEFFFYDIQLFKSNSSFISFAGYYQNYEKTLLSFAILEQNKIFFITFVLIQQVDDYYEAFTIQIQQQYQNIYLTKDYFILTNKTNMVTIKKSNVKQFYSSQLYNGFQNSFTVGYSNFILQSNQITTLSLYQFNQAYLLNQQPQGTGNITINCNDANTNSRINNTIQYQVLQFNDSGIYIQDSAIQAVNSSFYKAYAQMLSQYFVGPNITYTLNQIDCLYQEIDSYYLVLLINSTICTYNYFDSFDIYLVAYYVSGYLRLQYYQFNQKQNTAILYLSNTTITLIPTGIKTIQYYKLIQILIWNNNTLQLYTTELLYPEIIYQQTLNLSQALNQSSIIIKQVQVIENIIYVLCSSPNQLLKITMNKTSLSTPTIMNQFCVYNSIETNVVSYPNMLFINCQNQLIILRNSLQNQGYSIVLTYPYPQSQQAIIGPINEGIYFYFYNTTQSSLYFLNKFYLYTLQDGFKLKLQPVYTNLTLNPSLTYGYSNQFFYVVQDQNNQSFLSVFQGFFQQQKALLYSQYLEESSIQISASVYQSDIADIVGTITTETKTYYYFHDVTQKIVPIFNASLQNTLTQVLNISNQAINYNVSQQIFFQQEFLQINSSFQLQSLITPNTSGYTKINISEHFNGSIINYTVNCSGCSSYSYVQPLQQQKIYNLTKVTQSTSVNNFLYVFSGNNVVQINLKNQNASSAYQIISSYQGYTCGTIFIEIFSQNPGWLCIDSKLQQLIIFQYNQQNNQTSKLAIDLNVTLEFAIYTGGFVQIQSLNTVLLEYPYTVIFYSYLNNVQSYQYVLNSTLMPINKVTNVIPLILQIDYAQFMQYFGVIYQLTSNQMMVTLFTVNISNYSVQSVRTNFYVVRDIDFSYVSPSTLYGQQLEAVQDGLYTYVNVAIATNLNAIVVTLVFYDFIYIKVNNQCQLNQVNFTAIQSLDFSITGLNNLVVTQSSQDNQIVLNLFDTQSCSKEQMVQSIGQIIINQEVQEYQFINLVKQNLLALGTYQNLILYTVQSTLDIYYQFNSTDLSFSITAQNQLTSAQQNLTISLNQTVNPIPTTNSSGFKWYWILLIVIVSLSNLFKYISYYNINYCHCCKEKVRDIQTK